MSQVRFLDQVAISAFAQDKTTGNTSSGAVIPRIILPNTTFTVSQNTNVEVSELVVAEGGTLTIEGGELIIEGPPPVYSHGVLAVNTTPTILGTLINNGIFNVPF